MQLSEYADRYHTIRFERSAGVLQMTLHSQGGEVKWSVMPQRHHNELGHAFADVARDIENKVVVLTGTGNSFIAERAAGEQIPEANVHDMWDRMAREGYAMLENFLAIPVPVICAVNGPALIHSEIPVMADIVLAAEHAEFADTTHIAGADNVPGDGTQLIWPLLLGPNRGRHFLLTGARLSAQEALRLGVVAEVLPAERLHARALEIAAQLASRPLRVLRPTKMLLIRDLRRRLRDELELGIAAQGLAIV